METLEKYEELIWNWAKERNLDKVLPFNQACKTVEEAIELREALREGDLDKAKDAIGDVFVTIVICAKLLGYNLIECVDYAYEQIKDRKGKIINGFFVKEEDLKKMEEVNSQK